MLTNAFLLGSGLIVGGALALTFRMLLYKAALSDPGARWLWISVGAAVLWFAILEALLVILLTSPTDLALGLALAALGVVLGGAFALLAYHALTKRSDHYAAISNANTPTPTHPEGA